MEGDKQVLPPDICLPHFPKTVQYRECTGCTKHTCTLHAFVILYVSTFRRHKFSSAIATLPEFVPLPHLASACMQVKQDIFSPSDKQAKAAGIKFHKLAVWDIVLHTYIVLAFEFLFLHHQRLVSSLGRNNDQLSHCYTVTSFHCFSTTKLSQTLEIYYQHLQAITVLHCDIVSKYQKLQVVLQY